VSDRSGPGLGPTVVLGLAGAGLATVSSAQVWATARVTEPALRTVEARGGEVAPVALPLALVALASWGAVLVLRRRGRRVVAVLGLLAALGVAVAVVLRAHEAPDVAVGLLPQSADQVLSDPTIWPWLAVAGALVSSAASVVALRQAGRWPEMSSRYDAPAGEPSTSAPPPEEASSADLWKAMDEGRDPTE
jgi:uncharacterized membrane protein (TIGR02234 family)